MTNQREGNFSGELLCLLLIWIFGKDQQYLGIPKFDSAIFVAMNLFLNEDISRMSRPSNFLTKNLSNLYNTELVEGGVDLVKLKAIIIQDESL